MRAGIAEMICTSSGRWSDQTAMEVHKLLHFHCTRAGRGPPPGYEYSRFGL